MTTYAEAIIKSLESAGCDKAFGVSGGNIFPIWKALHLSNIHVHHCRHESGAVFAAMEYSLRTNKPVAVFVTSGPGITNAITGLRSARADGGRVIFIAALTGEQTSRTGPRQVQETLPEDVEGLEGLSMDSALHSCTVVKQPGDMVAFQRRLARVALDPRGGVMGVFLTPARGNLKLAEPQSPAIYDGPQGAASGAELHEQCHELLQQVRSVCHILWVGYGCRGAPELVRKFAELYRTPVLATPSAKGIFPENHPLYIGSTGIGSSVNAAVVKDLSIKGVIILGSRLAELSSLFIQNSWDSLEFYCVDLDFAEIRRNVPEHTKVIRAEIGDFLRTATSLGKSAGLSAVMEPSHSFPASSEPHISWQPATEMGKVHPVTVMAIVQDLVINRAKCPLLTDVGNSLCWAAHHLRFTEPGLYRTALSFSAMGHAACGVVGVAMAGHRAVAIVGDGAMLMQNEVSTAVQYGTSAIWLVMNDSLYGMCKQVPKAWEESAPPCEMPDTDFALYARALGCRGCTATTGEELVEHLEGALAQEGPTVIDVKIDGTVLAPNSGRAESLAKMRALEAAQS